MFFSCGFGYIVPIIGDFIGGIINYSLYNNLNEKIKTTFKINKDLSHSFFSYFKKTNWFLAFFSKVKKENENLIINYQEEFRKKNLDCILLLMDSILKGINFFEKI